MYLVLAEAVTKENRMSSSDDGRPRKIYVVDTNVMVNDPGSIDALRDEGRNLLIIPLMAIDELDGLKQRPDIGDGVREALAAHQAIG